ncbi:MAG TPA: VOC family protein [Gaiellaceae bacterium]|jgi:uncharacterized glyoxalase superfamily protein PhnB|nr:VOC family protein [Gaiellaceae bacterium]
MDYPTVFPTLTYDDAAAALDFLGEAFSAERHALYTGNGGAVRHAELRFGNGLVMLGSSSPEAPAPRGQGGGIYIAVADPDALCEQARRAGAEIVREPNDTDYGSREFSAKDPEGNAWHFGTYQPFDFDHATQEAKEATT